MNPIQKLYQELYKKYGKPSGQWILWCKRPKTQKEREEVLIGAILTQRTNWKNVEIAITNLKKKRICSLKSLARIKEKKLGPIIKSSGFYKSKSQYLLGLVRFIIKKYGNLKKMQKEDTFTLREKLLQLKGIGPETADSILLYVLDKPIFVIDEYTKRLVRKKKITNNLNYDFLQKLFMKNIKKDYRLYQDFHALIIIDGKSQTR